MILPLEAAKVKLFPSLYETAEFLAFNMQEWNRLWVEEVTPSQEEQDKVASRVQRACNTLLEARASAIARTAEPEVDAANDRPSITMRLSGRISSDGRP